METNTKVIVKKEQVNVQPVLSQKPTEIRNSNDGNCTNRKRKTVDCAGSQPLHPSSSPLLSAWKIKMMMKLKASKTQEPLQKARSTSIMLPNLEFENTIKAIKAKHGNIDKDCILKSERVRKHNLVCICDIFKELQNKRLDELNVASLEHYYEVVRDIEKLNINVKWLLERLDEIKDAITSRDEMKGFIGEKNEWTKKLEDKRRGVERLNNEIQIFEDQVDRLNKSIINRSSKFEKFLSMPLMDGLI